jgi:hypothetical protein
MDSMRHFSSACWVSFPAQRYRSLSGSQAGGSQTGASAARLARVLAPLGVAFLFARHFSYDAYYFPSLRRIGDGGVVGISWLIILALVALLTLGLPRLSPVFTCAATSILLLVCAFTAVMQLSGH